MDGRRYICRLTPCRCHHYQNRIGPLPGCVVGGFGGHGWVVGSLGGAGCVVDGLGVGGTGRVTDAFGGVSWPTILGGLPVIGVPFAPLVEPMTTDTPKPITLISVAPSSNLPAARVNITAHP